MKEALYPMSNLNSQSHWDQEVLIEVPNYEDGMPGGCANKENQEGKGWLNSKDSLASYGVVYIVDGLASAGASIPVKCVTVVALFFSSNISISANCRAYWGLCCGAAPSFLNLACPAPVSLNKVAVIANFCWSDETIAADGWAARQRSSAWKSRLNLACAGASIPRDLVAVITLLILRTLVHAIPTNIWTSWESISNSRAKIIVFNLTSAWASVSTCGIAIITVFKWRNCLSVPTSRETCWSRTCSGTSKASNYRTTCVTSSSGRESR